MGRWVKGRWVPAGHWTPIQPGTGLVRVGRVGRVSGVGEVGWFPSLPTWDDVEAAKNYARSWLPGDSDDTDDTDDTGEPDDTGNDTGYYVDDYEATYPESDYDESGPPPTNLKPTMNDRTRAFATAVARQLSFTPLVTSGVRTAKTQAEAVAYKIKKGGTLEEYGSKASTLFDLYRRGGVAALTEYWKAQGSSHQSGNALDYHIRTLTDAQRDQLTAAVIRAGGSPLVEKTPYHLHVTLPADVALSEPDEPDEPYEPDEPTSRVAATSNPPTAPAPKSGAGLAVLALAALMLA